MHVKNSSIFIKSIILALIKQRNIIPESVLNLLRAQRFQLMDDPLKFRVERSPSPKNIFYSTGIRQNIRASGHSFNKLDFHHSYKSLVL